MSVSLVDAICGDFIRDIGVESCDDGNTVGVDGCAMDCLSTETGWNCTESGSGFSTCYPTECGDGVVAVGYGAGAPRVDKVTASDAQSGDVFGRSASIDGDTVVVGAYLEDTGGSDAGVVYVYYRNNGGVDNWGEVTIIYASEAEANDQFGFSTSIDGDTVVVGAYLEDTGGSSAGAVYVYSRDNGGVDNWGEVSIIYASGAQASDQFGKSISISGDTVVVSAHREDTGGSSAGAVYVYYRNNGGVDNWGEVNIIYASDAQAGDYFGLSTSIDDDTVVVGAYGEDTGGSLAGAVYVYYRNNGGVDNWGEVNIIYASDAQGIDIFGYSTSIDDDTVVVGAYFEDTGGSEAGAAYVYYRNNGGVDNWGEVVIIYASDASFYDYFGRSAYIDGDTVVVGAYGDDTGGSNAGAVYVYYRNNGGVDKWGEVSIIFASDVQAGDFFGLSTSIDGDTVVVGAYGEDTGGSNAGAVYVFELPLGEVCDDGNSNNDDGCTSDCYAFETCGDGFLNSGGSMMEACDDGNTVGGDGCASDCTLETSAVCGDGMMEGVEVCDDGNTANDDGCSGNCSEIAMCGDSNLDNVSPATEECDDGNTVSEDGCSSLCLNEGGGGAPSPSPPSESCDGVHVGTTCASIIVVASVAGGGGVVIIMIGGAAFVVMKRGGKEQQQQQHFNRVNALEDGKSDAPSARNDDDMMSMNTMASLNTNLSMASNVSAVSGSAGPRPLPDGGAERRQREQDAFDMQSTSSGVSMSTTASEMWESV